MNIKEIFEREKIYRATIIDSYEHNKSIERIEGVITRYIKELEAENRKLGDSLPTVTRLAILSR